MFSYCLCKTVRFLCAKFALHKSRKTESEQTGKQKSAGKLCHALQTCKIWKVLPSVRRPSCAGSPGLQLPQFAESQLPRFAAPPVASTSQSRTRPFQEKVHIDKCAPPEGESSRNIRYTVVIAAAQRDSAEPLLPRIRVAAAGFNARVLRR